MAEVVAILLRISWILAWLAGGLNCFCTLISGEGLLTLAEVALALLREGLSILLLGFAVGLLWELAGLTYKNWGLAALNEVEVWETLAGTKRDLFWAIGELNALESLTLLCELRSLEEATPLILSSRLYLTTETPLRVLVGLSALSGPIRDIFYSAFCLAYSYVLRRCYPSMACTSSTVLR